MRRLPAAVGTNAFQTIGFVTIAPSVTVTFPTSLSFTFVSPVPLSANAVAYVAGFDPSNSAAGWTTILGPGTIIAGSTITFEATPAQLTLAGGMTYGFVLLVATQTLASPTPSPTLSPQPTSSPSPTPSPQPTLSPAPTPTPSPSPTATPSPQPTPTPSPQPTATPAPQPTRAPTSAPLGSPSVSPATVNIVSTSVPVTVTVREPGYTGSFVVNGARCAGVATIAPAGKTVGQYTVTGVAAGSCTITFADTFLQAVVLPVVVTTTTATITIG